MGGMGGMDDMDEMVDGWPAMTNWMSGMSNWWSTMANWCWDYTNMWDAGAQPGGASPNWWANLSRGAYHQMPMPVAAGRVPALNGLVVMDQDLQPVLSADVANPDTFGYRLRCSFTNQGVIPGAQATLQASATARATHFTMTASGLAPSTTYYMDINGSNVTPVATNRRGRLQVRQLPGGVTSLRGIGNVSIEDNHRNTILSAALSPH